jgi:hypothetical protein
MHDSDALVAGHERRRGLYRPVTVRGVSVGVAQPGRLHPDHDLAWAGLGIGRSSITSGAPSVCITAAFILLCFVLFLAYPAGCASG